MTTINHVPLLDLQAQYEPIKDDILAAFKEVFDSKQFIMGPKVEQLESEINAYCETAHSVGVSSGTDAILLALMALDIGQGDEVIIPPFTFFATAGCVARTGATPVFVDIEPDTYLMDANKIEAAITDKTKAIMPVHLFGQMCDMDAILEIAKKHNLHVIEDAAQAIGSRYLSKDGNWYKAGAMGTIGCFSFFPSKNLGACGDAGIATTQDADIAHRMRVLRVHGGEKRYFHNEVGANFRIDPIQAAALSVKLPLLEGWHKGRQHNAATYDDALVNYDVTTPVVREGRTMIYNQYTLRSPKRQEILDHLTERKVGNAIYYPLCLHLQECFAYLGYKAGDMPHAEAASNEVFSIPVYPELTADQLAYVVTAIQDSVPEKVTSA